MLSYYGGNVVAGMQDWSALLPLLGTEQCEEHAGSSLSRGFLSGAVTPLSLFGSLGLAKAGFKILLATVAIPHWGFWGATKLRDVGFKPSGTNVEFITIDPTHPRRHLVESRILDAVLDKLRIADDKKGSKLWDWRTSGLLQWNLRMAPGNQLHFPLRLLFPLIRILGGFLTVVSIQILIQARVMGLLTARNLFWELDPLVQAKILHSPLNQEFPEFVWDPETSSEICVSSLRDLVRIRSTPTSSYEFLRTVFRPTRWFNNPVSVDPEKNMPATAVLRSQIDALREELRQKVQSIQSRSELLQAHAIRWIFCSLLCLGVIRCVAGYIGCVTLVQAAPTNSPWDPFFWLIIETILSVVRMVVWSWRPEWDKVQGGVKLEVSVSPSSALAKYPRTTGNFGDLSVLPLYHSCDFLDSVKHHSGRVVERFDYPDVSLLYALIHKRIRHLRGAVQEKTVLCIAVFDHLRRAVRVCSEDDNGCLFFRTAFLEFDRDTPGVRARLGDPIITLANDCLVHDRVLRSALQEHYSMVNSQVERNVLATRRIRCDWTLDEMEDAP